MSRKRKRTFATWADAEIAWQAESKNAGCLAIALKSLVHGAVKWLPGEQPRMIGLCRLKDPHGGIVIVSEREMVCAYYLDDWLSKVQTTEAPTGKNYMPSYRSWLDIRRLAAAAKTEQQKAHAEAVEEAKGCQRTVPAPLVDQDIRTY